MPVQFIDLKQQYQEVKEELDASVAEILSSGAYVLGKYNQQLESEIAKMHGVKHAICVNSGTDALKIAMQAAGIGPGDDVITTAFTFVATVEVIAQLGARPVFIDIERDTFNLDTSKIDSAIGGKTKAICPVHLFGQLAKVTEIDRIAKEYGLTVIEDSAQTIGCHHNGIYTGNWGLAAGISFYVTKNLGAAGDGGMILTNDDEIERRSRSIRIHGMGRERYYYDELGYTSRMAELQAAVLCAKLKRLEDWNARRSEIASIYADAFAGSPIEFPTVSPGNNHVWHQYTILSKDRDGLMNHLRSKEIASAIFYPVPIHLHEPYAEYGYGVDSLPVTEQVSKECLSIPIHPHMTDDEVKQVASAILDYGV